MNWTRGLFRAWLVASIVWMPCGTYLLWDEFTAERYEYSLRNLPEPKGDRPFNEYDELIQNSPGIGKEEPINKYSIEAITKGRFNAQVAVGPDWARRRNAIMGLIGPPLVVPILGFALFWLGRLTLQIATWIVQGFRS